MNDNIRVAIMMGSASDLETMTRAAKELKSFGVPFDLVVTSAHRTPERTIKYVREAEQRGAQIFIVGAGMAAHLAGVVAAHTTRPVLGVPLGGPLLDGLDALLSTVQMPKGVPVGTLAVGGSGAQNAGILAVQILALADAELAAKLEASREAMQKQVEQASADAQAKLGDLLG